MSRKVIEVEALGYVSPAPRLVLFVSCPADVGNRELLEEEDEVQITLYKTRQRWPKPTKGYRTDLPIRYVKKLKAVKP